MNFKIKKNNLTKINNNTNKLSTTFHYHPNHHNYHSTQVLLFQRSQRITFVRMNRLTFSF